jgi:hypothetical protein
MEFQRHRLHLSTLHNPDSHVTAKTSFYTPRNWVESGIGVPIRRRRVARSTENQRTIIVHKVPRLVMQKTPLDHIFPELVNVYLSPDINSVSELHGQRLYKHTYA